MARIRILKGSIPLRWPRNARVDFAVFPAGYEDVCCTVDYLLRDRLLDGRKVVVCPWNTSFSQNRPMPRRWDAGVQIPECSDMTSAPRKIRQAVSLLLQRTCSSCGRPTRYELRLLKKMQPGFLGPDAYDCVNTCSRCLNVELIEHLIEGYRFWRVFRYSSTFIVCDRYQEDIGSVVYDASRRRLHIPATVPDQPIGVPEGHTICIGEQETPVLTLIYRGGILVAHDHYTFLRLSRAFGFQLEQGVKIGEITAYLDIQTGSLCANARVYQIIFSSPRGEEGEEQREERENL